MAVHQQGEEEIRRLRDFEEFANLKMSRLDRENEVLQKDLSDIDSEHAKELTEREIRIFQLEVRCSQTHLFEASARAPYIPLSCTPLSQICVMHYGNTYCLIGCCRMSLKSWMQS